MYPHERSLVSRMQGRPFAFLGVNTDRSAEVARAVLARQGLGKRCWWDGAGGPIARRYEVEAFPGIFVLDARGVIRHRQVFGEELDAAVEELVREAEAKGS